MSVPIWATSPLPCAVLGVLLLAILWRRLPRWLAIAGIVIEVLLCVVMTPFGADLLVHAVESRVPPTGSCTVPAPSTIVVLGAGYDHSPNGPDDYAALRHAGLQRVFAGVALWRQLPGARLVMAGGAGGSLPEAVPMANLAVALGVPVGEVEIEGHSHNTWQNARNVAMLSPAVPRHIWLVTSALHLPRALGAFRAWGFEPCAWSAGSMRVKFWAGAGSLMPQATAARRAALALHEMMGGVEYQVLEWRRARTTR